MKNTSGNVGEEPKEDPVIADSGDDGKSESEPSLWICSPV